MVGCDPTVIELHTHLQQQQAERCGNAQRKPLSMGPGVAAPNSNRGNDSRPPKSQHRCCIFVSDVWELNPQPTLYQTAALTTDPLAIVFTFGLLLTFGLVFTNAMLWTVFGSAVPKGGQRQCVPGSSPARTAQPPRTSGPPTRKPSQSPGMAGTTARTRPAHPQPWKDHPHGQCCASKGRIPPLVLPLAPHSSVDRALPKGVRFLVRGSGANGGNARAHCAPPGHLPK